MTQTFDDRIAQLIHFESQEGHLFVPIGYAKHHALGRWVNNTRTRKKNGLLNDKDKIRRLDEIGFVWEVPKGAAKQEWIEWGKHFKFLVSFHKSKGHCNIPATIAGKPIPTADWCKDQRALFLDQKLEQEKIDKLSKLNFDFYWSDDDTSSNEQAAKRQRAEADSDVIQALQEEVRALKAENDKLHKELKLKN